MSRLPVTSRAKPDTDNDPKGERNEEKSAMKNQTTPLSGGTTANAADSKSL